MFKFLQIGIIALIFISSLTLNSVAYSQNNPLVEAPQFTFFYDAKSYENFDVAGVRLGMTLNEALEAIKSKLKITDQYIKTSKQLNKNIVTNTKEVNAIRVEGKNYKILIKLQPAVPFDKTNPMRVWLIEFEMPRTTQNLVSMRNLAFKKYGPPSDGVRKTDHESRGYEWCFVENSAKRKLGCLHSDGGPKIKLNPPKLIMSDPSYLKAVTNYSNQLKSSKPNF